MSSEEPKKTPPAADNNKSKPAAASPTAKPPAAAAKPAAASSSSPPAKATPPPAPAAAPKPAAATPPPAKKEPEPPAFEKGLAQQLTTRFGDIVKIVYIRPLRIKVMVAPANIVEVATYIRDNMGFDHAESAGGTDYPKDKQIEVAYHLGSYTRDDLLAHILVLATRTDRDDARMPSLINVYKSVEYHERETFEMLGVYFEGHPRNERFLLPEDWADIPPLRKDFRIKGR